MLDGRGILYADADRGVVEETADVGGWKDAGIGIL